MSAVPVTLVGVMTAEGGSSFNCTFNGIASISGLGVGGGPVIPPSDAHPEHPIAPGGPPPHIEHPIVLPPVEPGQPPVEIWPSPGRPAHPIVLPPEPTPPQPPETVTVLKAPPPSGGWGAVSSYGWAYYPAQSEPQPKG